jgi:hypothetical protein
VVTLVVHHGVLAYSGVRYELGMAIHAWIFGEVNRSGQVRYDCWVMRWPDGGLVHYWERWNMNWNIPKQYCYNNIIARTTVETNQLKLVNLVTKYTKDWNSRRGLIYYTGRSIFENSKSTRHVHPCSTQFAVYYVQCITGVYVHIYNGFAFLQVSRDIQSSEYCKNILLTLD